VCGVQAPVGFGEHLSRPSGFEVRTFECSTCGRTEQVSMSLDPLKTDAVSWLAGELKPRAEPAEKLSFTTTRQISLDPLRAATSNRLNRIDMSRKRSESPVFRYRMDWHCATPLWILIAELFENRCFRTRPTSMR
jgi:hypothetical protein